MIGDAGGLAKRGAGREREGERRDDGVAGPGDVRNLIGSDDGNVIGGPIRLEQGHAAAAAGDEDGLAVEALAQRHTLTFAMAPSQIPETFVAKKFGADAFLLAKPLTYMNRSGDAVSALTRYYDVAPADVLVVYDDIDLPFTRLRARAKGSAGTHNGMRSIVERLGTTEFPRLRLGVGRGDARRDLADHVLAKFEPDEQSELEAFITRAADAAELFAAADILDVMNKYNAGPADPAESN